VTYGLGLYQRTQQIQPKDTAPKGRDTQEIHINLKAISKDLWQESTLLDFFFLIGVILLLMLSFSVTFRMTIFSEYTPGIVFLFYMASV